MARLGGSPLGLIGVLSGPKDGRTTFNGGVSGNVNVNVYNTGKVGDDNALFSNRRRLRAWPEIREVKNNNEEAAWDVKGSEDVDYDALRNSDGKTGDKYVNNSSYTSFGYRALHNNDVYDTSILNILEKVASYLEYF